MRIGVMADSHENMPMIARAVAYFNAAGVSQVLHAGDIISPLCCDLFSRLQMKMTAVFGNNDGEKTVWRRKAAAIGAIHDSPHALVINGCRVLLMHAPGQLEQQAASGTYDLIIYGHTHIPDCRVVAGTTILNPGECGGWLTGQSTIALVQLPEKDVRFVTLSAEENSID